MYTHPLVVLLIAGAALLAAAPPRARHGLLPEGSHPPAFTLPDRAGHLVDIRTFLGPRRIILLFGPTQAFVDTIQAHHVDFTDRDLTVLAVVPPGSPLTAASGPVHLLTDTDGLVARQYHVADGRPAFYLIGKDGHIALARRDSLSPHALFGIIDAMPMRRREMRERGR